MDLCDKIRKIKNQRKETLFYTPDSSKSLYQCLLESTLLIADIYLEFPVFKIWIGEIGLVSNYQIQKIIF